MHPPRLLAVAAAVGLAVLAPAAPAVADPGGTASTPDSPRQRQFAAAAAAYGVPESVLLGVSYLESRWDTHAGAPSTSAGYGPMHLTDAAAHPVGDHHGGGEEDARGDDARPARPHGPTGPTPVTEPHQTLDKAAALTGLPKQILRTDPAANLRGGAALLADHQRSLGAPATADPADWYGAVAKYSGANEASAAASFADEVYATIATGEQRVTDDGSVVRLPAHSVTPRKNWLDRLGWPWRPRPDGLDCPNDISCEWIPAPYQQLDANDPTEYGNHDKSNRPHNQRIEYIVIHDTETSYEGTIAGVTNPAYLSWHYTIRSRDGHIAQHLKMKDVGWHAGNWYVNAKAIGIEHEGFLAEAGTWYTEAMYRTSAKLVRHLAFRYGIPLDRNHIIGHDNVPGTTAANVRGMHVDPGPFWDWAHYFDLMKAPLRGVGGSHGGLVMIKPDFATHRAAYTGCDKTRPAAACPPQGSSAVILRTEPRPDAPLARDIGKRPDSDPTMDVYDHSARASTGQLFAYAGRHGDWTAIWYLGNKVWFHNPASAPTAVHTLGLVVTPKRGKATIPVFGRAYPEASAYPAEIPVQAISPLQYTIAAGQRYAVGNVVPGEYYRATTFNGVAPGDHTVVRGKEKYVQIQLGHRIAFVHLDDVQILPALR